MRTASSPTAPGKVVKRFTVVMNCSWQGNEGVLDEDFTYSDGNHPETPRVAPHQRLADGNATPEPQAM